jgi:hypothetical protein
MSVTVFASLETATAFKATVASEAFLETSVTVVASALSFICSVCLVLVILLVLIKVIVQGKSFGKELL